jgi:hypothetical protein
MGNKKTAAKNLVVPHEDTGAANDFLLRDHEIVR